MIQRNIRKRNQSFGYGKCISFIFGLRTSFEMSEGRLNVSFFSGRQIISYSKGVVLVNLVFIMYQTYLATESNFKCGHPLINDAFHNYQQSLSIKATHGETTFGNILWLEGAKYRSVSKHLFFKCIYHIPHSTLTL